MERLFVYVVLLGSFCMMHASFGRYDDPSDNATYNTLALYDAIFDNTQVSFMPDLHGAQDESKSEHELCLPATGRMDTSISELQAEIAALLQAKLVERKAIRAESLRMQVVKNSVAKKINDEDITVHKARKSLASWNRLVEISCCSAIMHERCVQEKFSGTGVHRACILCGAKRFKYRVLPPGNQKGRLHKKQCPFNCSQDLVNRLR